MAVPFALVTVDGARRARRWVRIFAVITVITVLLGLVLVQRTFGSISSSLDVAAESIEVARDAVEPAAALADQVAELSAVVGEAAGTNIADGIDGFAATAERLADVAETVERFIPGDTDPSPAEELRGIADGLEPLPGQLRSTGETLQASTAELDEIASTIRELPVVIDDVARELQDARDRIAVDIWIWRLAIVALGVLLLAGARVVDVLLGSVDQAANPPVSGAAATLATDSAFTTPTAPSSTLPSTTLPSSPPLHGS